MPEQVAGTSRPADAVLTERLQFAPMPLEPGLLLGPYEIVGPLGAGGMGEVYRARDTNLERDVALKILPEALADDGERLERFEREAKTPYAPDLARGRMLRSDDSARR